METGTQQLTNRLSGNPSASSANQRRVSNDIVGNCITATSEFNMKKRYKTRRFFTKTAHNAHRTAMECPTVCCLGLQSCSFYKQAQNVASLLQTNNARRS
eukprot:5494004-Amphidinium_carterae.1